MSDRQDPGDSPPVSPLPSAGPSDPVASVLERLRAAIAGGVTSRAEFERLKGQFLGREKGLVPALFAGVRDLPPAERAGFGARANAAKREIEETIGRLSQEISRRESETRERDGLAGMHDLGEGHAEPIRQATFRLAD